MTETKGKADPRFSEVDGLVFVIGAQKAGTTWLHSYFSRHPEVSFPRFKEYNYWNAFEGASGLSSRLEKAYQEEMPRSLYSKMIVKVGLTPTNLTSRQFSILSGYRACSRPGRPHTDYAIALGANRKKKTRLMGEACPQYAFLKSETFAEMQTLSPNTKFIYVMREPVSRLISSLKHQIRMNRGNDAVTPDEFEAAVQRTLKEGGSYALRHSQTNQVIERLEATGANVFYTFYEHLFRDETIRDMCAFLGISYRPGDFEKRVNFDPSPQMPVKPELKALIAEKLAHIYPFVRERFGNKVPTEWIEAEERYLGGVSLHA